MSSAPEGVISRDKMSPGLKTINSIKALGRRGERFPPGRYGKIKNIFGFCPGTELQKASEFPKRSVFVILMNSRWAPRYLGDSHQKDHLCD